jgi:hypothetical protein
MDSVGPGQEPVVRFCEHGNETYGSIKDEGFMDQLSNY